MNAHNGGDRTLRKHYTVWHRLMSTDHWASTLEWFGSDSSDKSGHHCRASSRNYFCSIQPFTPDKHRQGALGQTGNES
ncbi:MAG: hypothetical protein F6K09_35770 [Merismopedia sp. SIO2A8]|nr:hypothetical protein [Merismopedia sp. SIO2A8]